jgi:hypothetical protein
MFTELRGLSQAVIQNGGSLSDIIELYSTDSVRQMKKVFKTLKNRQDELQNQASQQKQQQLDQQQQQAQAALQQAQQQHEAQIAHEDYQKDLDRINKVEVATIMAESKGMPVTDNDKNGIPDALEISKLQHEQDKASKDYQSKLMDIQTRAKQDSDKMAIEREKLQVARENQANDVKVAEINARNRASKKTK